MTGLYETPAHLYPAALVADGDGGDAPAFELPADLSAPEVTDDTLGELEAAAVALVDTISADPAINAEGIAHLETLAQAIEALRTEAASRIEAAEGRQAEVDAIRQRINPTASDAEPGDGEPDPDAPPADGAEGGEGGEPAVVPGEPADPDTATRIADGAEPEPVTAGAPPRRQPLRVPARAVPAPVPAPDPDSTSGRTYITAAADINGVAIGSELADGHALANAMSVRARNLGRADRTPPALVASVHTASPYPVIDDTVDGDRFLALFREQVLDVIPDSAEALVAAGGWCAPSERIYSFFGIEAVDGLVNLPTRNITRGGLEFPVSPSIADVFDDTWEWTEAMDITALDPEDEDFATKPCFGIPCGTFGNVRLTNHGICISTGNLSSVAWPEQNRRYMDLVAAAHEHAMNRRTLVRMTALATAVAIADSNSGAAAPILDAVELQAEDYRDKFRMADNAVLEVVFPRWVRYLFRADLARRTGVDLLSVPNSRIDSLFLERQVAPQFVQDYQPLNLTVPAAGDGFRELAPTSVVFLMYAAGTLVRGRGGRIDLGVVRDSTLNETNDHIAAWSEEADLVAKIGHEVRSVTVPVDTTGVLPADVAA